MATLPVIWSQSAEADLVEILDVIAQNNPENLSHILELIYDSGNNLGSFPLKHRIVPELQAQSIVAYRERIVSPWRIIYHVREADVMIAAVVDGRRDFDDHLMKRVLRAN